ncbi:MAG TPA: 3-oxoacyl-[acyl-carrier-protein] reductase, partial [Bacteroidetes bacterium]|nr:3-oxoacyl-[acyl-carrier-protein] reductase [Bacteroidota bacterium]
MKLLKDKVAIITGASRGIGKAIAMKFAENGADIAFTDIRRDENMENVEKELSSFGVKAKGYASDASSFQSSADTVTEILKDFGKVDILVNNAGITRDNLLMRMTEQDWDLVMNINLKSVFNLTKQILRPMMKQRSGSIINISSVVGVFGNAGQANYSASKAGIIGFTKSVAKELGSRNIRSNAIAPGFIETEMTKTLPEEVRKGFLDAIPLKRMGSGEDVANAA